MTSLYAHLEKPSMVDYPQHLAAVFFTSGCNFSCGFCHNAALMGKQQHGLSKEHLHNTCTRFKNQWVNGVVISGGEPTLAPDLPELIQLFKAYGFAVKLDTNGSNPDALAKCLPLVDYVAMDIKTGLSGYPDLVGFNQTDRINRSIQLIQEQAHDYEFRTTVIDSIHTDEVMAEARDLINGSKRYILQPFIPRDTLPNPKFRALKRTPRARLEQLKTLMKGCADELLLRGA